MAAIYGWIHEWVPHWVIGMVIMIVPALIVLTIYRWFTRRLIRLAGRFSPFLQTLLERGQGPASTFVVILVLGAALPAARFPYGTTIAIGRALLLAFILTIGWAAAIAIDIATAVYLRRFRTDTEDNLLARKHVTQMRILQRVAKTLLALVTVGAALMTFELGPAIRGQPVRLGRGRRPGAGSRGAPGAGQSARRHSDRDHPAVSGRGPGRGRGRNRVDRDDHQHLCRGPAVGFAADDRAVDLFHREAVPELDL